ncbi:MAG TPA: Rid family hydrolase [Bryobacteraceae bacterium]|nr:Rid family hydrolase [Bryobacteraceae bacterium]
MNLRGFAIALLLCALVLPVAAAQKNKKNAIPFADLPVRPSKEDTKKDLPQPATLAREPRVAVTADTSRLVFRTSMLESKGLLSQQTRDALKGLLRAHGSDEIVKLRAFVAGSGDLRRVQDMVAEVFSDKRELPALTVVQVGALPLDRAQVVIESTAEAKKPVNANGVAFVSAQSASSLDGAVARVKELLKSGGMQMGSLLRMTCFVSSLEGIPAQPAGVPIDVNIVQMQRQPVRPAAACEAVARLEQPRTQPLQFVDGSSGAPAMAVVSAPRVVMTGSQLGFGEQETDVKQAFERLQKDVTDARGDMRRTVMAHYYLLSHGVSDQVRKLRGEFEGSALPASTMLGFEGLPSIDAVFAMDVIALPAGQ